MTTHRMRRFRHVHGDGATTVSADAQFSDDGTVAIGDDHVD